MAAINNSTGNFQGKKSNLKLNYILHKDKSCVIGVFNSEKKKLHDFFSVENSTISFRGLFETLYLNLHFSIPLLILSTFLSNFLAFLGDMLCGIPEIQEEGNRFWQSWMGLFQCKN